MDQLPWKILIVDDDEDDYILVRYMLADVRPQKYELIWAETYEAGLQALQSGTYDVILMDYDLGARSGIELTREVVASKVQSPIILFTGRGSYSVDIEAMEAGATMYLTKSEVNSLLLERTIRYAIERKQAEEKIRRRNAILQGINRIFSRALTSQSEEDLGQACLEVIEQVTDSKFGFIGEINTFTGRLDDIAISNPGWDVCQIGGIGRHGRTVPGGFAIHGLYGQVILDGESFYTNDPASHPASIGTPPGHPPLTAFLGVPLTQAGKTIGLLGLGNREGGYGPEELEAAEALAPAIVQALMSQRAETALRQANSNLQTQAEELEVQTEELRTQADELSNANQKLHENEERFRNFLESTHDTFFALDNRWCFVYANQRYCESIGEEAGSLIGKNFWQVLPRYSGSSIEKYYRKAMARKAPVHFQSKGFYSDNWYEVSIYPTQDGISIFARCITAEHKAHTMLVESERRFTKLFEAMQEAFFLCEMIYDENLKPVDFRFLEVNPACEFLIGIKREDAVGRSIREVFPDSNFEFWRLKIGQVAQSGWPAHFEHQGSKSRRYYEIYAYSPQQGQCAVIFNDVTARNQSALLRSAINEINQTLLSTQDINKILQSALTASCKALGSETGAISLRKGDCWVASYVYGFPASVVGSQMNDDEERHAVLAIQTQKPVAVNDALNDSRVNQDHMRKWSIRSVLVIPVLLKGEAIGVVFFNYQSAPFKFRDYHIQFGVDLAASISLALENARLFENMNEEIRQHRQDEEALQFSQQRFTTLLKTTQAGYWMFNTEGKILEVNEPYCRMSGYRQDEIIRMHIWDLETTETQEDILEHIRMVMETGHHQFESRHRRKDGTIFDVDIRATYLDVEGGRLVIFIWDISDRKKAERALQESEARFRAMADTMLQIVWTADASGAMDYYNQRGYDYGGVQPGDIQGWEWESVLHPDDVQPTLAAWKRAIETGEPYEIEQRLRRFDGEYRWHLTRGNAVRDEQGCIVRWIGTSTDIHTQKQTEQELLKATYQSEQNQLILDAVIQQMPVGVILTDASGKFTRNNLEMDRIWRSGEYSQEVIAGHQFQAIHPDGSEYQPEEWPLSRAIKKGEIVLGEEMTILRGDGTKGILHVSAAPIRGSNGEIIAGVVIDVDMTERKRMEEELRESERKYRELIQYAPAGIYEVDFRTRRFTSVNDAMCDLTDYTREELLQTNPMDILDDRGKQLFQERMNKWLAGEKPDENVEYRVVAKDGHEIYAVLNVTFTIDENGIPKGATVIGHDVTERKRAQALLERHNEAIREYSRRLEQSNRELEDFAMIASHDLQEPLRKIEHFSRLLAERAEPVFSETERDYLERLQKSTAHMRKMIEDLLALSRVTTKGQSFQPVDLGVVMGDVLDDLDSRIQQSGAKIELGELPSIQADASQMHQLFLNLISNSLKFQKPGEPPVVRIQSINIPDQRIEIRVEDNGIGINMDFAGKLFHPFQRLHGRSEYEGTGIGLSICRKIVERHGGQISVESELGKGATFIVRLPGSG